MIFILLGLILGFLYGLQEEGFSFGILVALGGFLAGSFIWFIFGGIVGVTLPTVDKVQKYELCALNDNTSIQGRKYLFSGRIDGELVYRYIINTEKDRYTSNTATNIASKKPAKGPTHSPTYCISVVPKAIINE